MTALLYAIWYANIDIVESLLDAGADINYKISIIEGLNIMSKESREKKIEKKWQNYYSYLNSIKF
jgi:ankyrin repeat protein